MHHVKVKTNSIITTEVTINGKPVDEYLKKICYIAHDALNQLSQYRQDHNLPDDIFEELEGEFCQLLDELGD